MSVSVLLVMVLALSWCLVMGEFSLGQAILGVGFGSVFVVASGTGRGRRLSFAQIARRVGYAAIYLLVLIPYGIVLSNLDMAWRLLRLRPAIRPGIVRVRLGAMSEATSALVGHAITMTPGAMVVDYSDDGRTMYVHVIDVTHVERQRADFWSTYRLILRRIFP